MYACFFGNFELTTYRYQATYSWIDTAQLQIDIDKFLASEISNRRKCIDIELVLRDSKTRPLSNICIRKGTRLPASVMMVSIALTFLRFYSLGIPTIGNATNVKAYLGTATITLRKHCRNSVWRNAYTSSIRASLPHKTYSILVPNLHLVLGVHHEIRSESPSWHMCFLDGFIRAKEDTLPQCPMVFEYHCSSC